MVDADNRNVFMDLDAFAERRTVICSGEAFMSIPIVLTGAKNQVREKRVSDHTEGVFYVTSVLHCRIQDLGGEQPERGERIRISGDAQGDGFYREFRVATSTCEMGMLRIELEAYDE